MSAVPAVPRPDGLPAPSRPSSSILPPAHEAPSLLGSCCCPSFGSAPFHKRASRPCHRLSSPKSPLDASPPPNALRFATKLARTLPQARLFLLRRRPIPVCPTPRAISWSGETLPH